MKSFSLIAACDKEMGIGKGGTLPWRLPGELAYFHRVTSEVVDGQKRNAVIMGRKTWESIPEGRRPLPGRLNCVITRDVNYQVPEGVLRFGSLEECLAYLNRHPVLDTGSRSSFPRSGRGRRLDSRRSLSRTAIRGGNDKMSVDKAFIIGGGELFRQTIIMRECVAIYLTEVNGVFGCDTFFPAIPRDQFQEVDRSDVQEENGITYQFVTYKRK